MAGGPVETVKERLEEAVPPLQVARQQAVHGLHAVGSVGSQAQDVITRMLALGDELDKVLKNLRAGSDEVAAASTGVGRSYEAVSRTDFADSYGTALADQRDGLKTIAGDYLVAGQKAAQGVNSLKESLERLVSGAAHIEADAATLKKSVADAAEGLTRELRNKTVDLDNILRS